MAPIPPATEPRRGFLPIQTNLFDRIFVGVVIGIALHLAWMRFLEAQVPLYVATVLSVALGWWIAKRG